MEDLSPLKFENKRFPCPESEENPFVRVSRHKIFQQIALVLGMGAAFLGANGCNSIRQKNSIPQPKPSPLNLDDPERKPKKTEETTKPTRTIDYAITERSLGEEPDKEFFHTPIILEPYSRDLYISHEQDLHPITFDIGRRPARSYANYQRVTDREGDIELAYYHWRATHEWPRADKGPPSPDLLRDGRLALGDWLFEQTRRQLETVVRSPHFDDLKPQFWRKNEEEEEELNLTFDLSHNPREHPLALARMTDNVSQLLAFLSEKASPDDPQMRALVRPLYLFLYHILGRMSAHLAHESAHGMNDHLEVLFQGYRQINGIPAPAIFPQITFEDEEGNFSRQEDYWRDQYLSAIAAGPNQHTLHNRLIYLRNLEKQGPFSVYDGWTYIIQNIMMPGSAPLGYMLSDQQHEDEEHHPGDMNHYRRLMAANGLEIELDQMIRNKVISVLSSAESYRALIAIINEVIGWVGDSIGVSLKIPDMPSGIRVLGADIHWPHVEHYLTNRGELLHISLPINRTRSFPIMLEFSTDLDNTQPNAKANLLRGGMMVGHRFKYFLLEGGGAIATHRDQLSDIRTITGTGRLTIPISETGISLSLQIDHQKDINGNDPINDIFGMSDGTSGTFLLQLRW